MAEKHGLLEARGQEIGELTARTNDLQEQITCLELTNKQTVKEARAAARTLEDNLHARVRELEAIVSEQSQLLHNRTAELENTQSEAVALRQRVEALELTVAQTQAAASAATEIRETLQSELVTLRTALEQKDLSLQQNYTATRELEDRLNTQLGELQNQLTDKQGLLEARNQEIGQLTARTNDLQGQLAEKHGLLEARSQEINQLTAGTNNLQEEITRLQQASRQTVEESQAAARTLEDSLNTRLRELETTVSEKSQLLHNRTVELENTQSETSALRQRIQQLELTGAQIEAAKNDADRMRAALRNELNNAHTALEQKDTAFAQREREFRESSERLNAQLQILHNQLAETQQLLEAKDRTLSDALIRIAGLEERIGEMESLCCEAQVAATTEVERVRQQSQSELEALRTELRDKQQALQHQHAAVAEFEANLKGQIHDLANQLTETQAWLERRDREFEQLGSEAAFLRERIAQLESAAHEAGRSSGAEAERIRGELQAELVALQGQLNEKEHGLAESQAFMRESESRWQSQIHDLQIQLTEKQLLLEVRNVEIVGWQGRLSAISDQLATLESASQQAAATAARNAELDRQQFAAEMISRQEELRNMERHLADREAQSDDLRQSFNTQLGELQNQLTDKQGLLEARNQEIGQLTARTNDLQGQLAEKHGLLEARSQEINQLTAGTNNLQEEITRLQQASRQTVEESQAAARTLEDSLNTRLRELETTVSEKSQLLHNRTVELENTQSETSALRQRIQQLELTGAQIEAAKNDADRMRAALRNELNNAHTALEQKDTAFAQREREFRESSERLNAQLQILHNQLAEERRVLEDQKHELQGARSETIALRNHIEELESSKGDAEKTAQLAIARLTEDYQLELAVLRADLDKQQLALAERQTTIRALEKDLKGERHRLEAQAAEQQTLLDRGGAELQEQRLAISALREELARSEFARGQTELLATAQAKQIREQVKSEVGALDAQLTEKEATLKALTDRARELESVFSGKIDDLHRQLSDKRLLIESRDNEMAELRTQISALLEQISRLERANGQALEQHRIAASDLEQSLRLQLNELQSRLADRHAALAARNKEIQGLELQVSQSDLAIKHAETKAAAEIAHLRRQSESQLESLQAEIDWKVEDLQRREAAVYATEQNLQAEINALAAEVAEKRALLESRNDELLRVKAEMDGLQERIIYLGPAATEAQLQATNKDEATAEQDRAELAKLWNELGQTEQMLEQRQAAVNDLEGDVQAQINKLRSELADRQALLENPSKGFLLGEPTLTESQKEKLNRLEQLVETIKADNEQTLISPHNRRWRFSLGRKRRWKS